VNRQRFPVCWLDSLAVVTLPAEIGTANARQLDEELGFLLNVQHASPLVADMMRTRVCDAAGLAALIRARKRASVLGTGLRVAAGPRLMTRLRQAQEAGRLLVVYPSLDGALAQSQAG
jgi:anti-anti-sigma regulatory factor